MAILHIHARPADPAYRSALAEHDGRMEDCFVRFKDFAERADRRRGRRGASA